MKKTFFVLLCAVFTSACLGTHYFEPEVVDTSDPQEKLSHEGDTCWFQVTYNQVMTRFQPGYDFKPFKYVIEIKGRQYGETVVVETDRDLARLIDKLEDEFPEFYEKWYQENGSLPKSSSGVIAFAVPRNLTQEDRTVEVKVCVSKKYHDTEEWGEWETVFSAVQGWSYAM